MFPLRDSVPKYQAPIAVYGIIVLNALVFLYQNGLDRYTAIEFAYTFGFVPAAFFGGGAFPNGQPLGEWWPLITSAFLHGGWLHIILNMWTLFIFGSTLESRMGAVPFLIFYLICAVASTYAHGYFNPFSNAPVIGASGAIAGVIGAYALRFPTARITLLVPIIIIPFIFSVPALAYAAIWFGIQLLQGTWDAMMPSMGGGIAWWAHIGGFLTGMILLPIFLIFTPALRKPARIEHGPWD
jgi:membrane associated rhomboid family serine protease